MEVMAHGGERHTAVMTHGGERGNVVQAAAGPDQSQGLILSSSTALAWIAAALRLPCLLEAQVVHRPKSSTGPSCCLARRRRVAATMTRLCLSHSLLATAGRPKCRPTAAIEAMLPTLPVALAALVLRPCSFVKLTQGRLMP
jgi:hypothetical protein